MKKILVGLTAAVISLSAMAQDQEKKAWNQEGRPEHRGGGGKEMMEKLNLTEDQKAKMKVIREDGRKQMEELNSQSLTEDVRKEKRKALMEANKEKINAVLTADQKKQWEAMKHEMGKHEGKPGMGGPGGKEDRMEHLQQIAKDLNLTPDQTTKFTAAHMALKDKTKDIRDNNSLTDEQKKEQEKSAKKDFKASIKQILTTEQIQKLKEQKKNRPDMKGEDDEK